MTASPITARHAAPDCPADAPEQSPTPAMGAHHGRRRERVTIPDQVANTYGIPLPVQIAATVWDDVVAWSDAIAARVKRHLTGQSEGARMAELLTATQRALSGSPWNSQAVQYVLRRVPSAGPIARLTRVTLTVQLVNDRDHGPVFVIEHAYADLYAQADKFTAPWIPAFPAPAWEVDALGNLWPMVTTDVLDELMATAHYEMLPRGDRRSVDVIPSREYWPHARGVRLYVQGYPDLWSLQPLGWTFTRTTTDEPVVTGPAVSADEAAASWPAPF